MRKVQSKIIFCLEDYLCYKFFNMPVITLTTEWRADDFYMGIIRGKLSSLCPATDVIVNASGIPPFNIAHASFIIRNTYANYPEGSVHIICVHSENDSGSHLIVKAFGHYFIGSDNGIFNLILNTDPDLVLQIRNENDYDDIEVFARTAAEIISGKEPSLLGTPCSNYSEKLPLRATIEKDVITGSIIFIDSYGNAISNITREVFYRVFENREYRILIQSNRNYTRNISKRYSDVPVGEMLARFNQLDLLEISVNGANIAELLSIETGSVLRIDAVNKSVSANRLL
jgi:S-adenosyl-L-methionine hydrolase (adenosine-forming)